MKLTFWGAARTVTGSMHLVEVAGKRLLLDCGLYQGHRKKAFDRNRNLPLDARQIDAVILSHAHIDHSGNLPSLVGGGFKGPIFATDATCDLAMRMLEDSAGIQESDVRYVNKQRRREGKRLFEPLYTRDDAAATVKQFVPIDYGHRFSPIANVEAIFFDAGHMLGSASVAMDISENGDRRRLVFSGDIGRADTPILRDPQVVTDADFLIMESTYGNRTHASRGRIKAMLKEAAEETAASRGKLIIPAFSVGRTQEIVYRLNQLWGDGELPTIPVFVDSPLAIDATEIYRDHPECFDAEVVAALVSEEDHDAFGFWHLRYVRSSKESKKLNDLDEPAVIVAASGMCEGGRIVHHLRNHIEDPTTQILFAGYQAAHTLGRKILDGVDPVPILGRHYRVKAKVDRIEGLSAHADRDELLDWAGRAGASGKLKRVFLVHGELEPAESLAAGLREQGVDGVDIPDRGDVFEI